MHFIRTAAVALCGLAVASCAADPYSGAGPAEGAGTFLGTFGGALIGSQFGGGNSGRLAGTLAGAAIGAFIGNRIGASLDEEDRQRAYEAQLQALDKGQSGSAVGWRSPSSGRYGSVVPGPSYQSNGLYCRQYTHTIYVDGRPQMNRGTACRNPDGTWTAMS